MKSKIKWEKVEKWDNPTIFWDESGKEYKMTNAGVSWIEDDQAGNYEYGDAAFGYATDNDGKYYRVVWQKNDYDAPVYNDETDTENIDWNEADIEEA